MDFPREAQGLMRVDVLEGVAAGPVPTAVARRERLVELRRQVLALVRDEGLLAARASWRIVALRSEPDASGWLDLDGGRLQAPRLVPASGRLTGVACAAATLGDAIERRIAGFFAERRASLAVALDAVANELLFALSRRVQDRLLAAARKRGLCVAGELRAGDPGLALDAQRTVLALAGAETLGVWLSSALMMSPNKSTSFIQGVGLDLPHEAWSRCDACRFRERCALLSDPAFKPRNRARAAASTQEIA